MNLFAGNQKITLPKGTTVFGYLEGHYRYKYPDLDSSTTLDHNIEVVLNPDRILYRLGIFPGYFPVLISSVPYWITQKNLGEILCD